MKNRQKIAVGDPGSATFGPGVSTKGLVVTGCSEDDHGISSTLQKKFESEIAM